MRRLSAVLVLVAACYQPTVQSGLPCSPLGECPVGQRCDSRGVCLSMATDDASGDLDAPPDDATDAPALIDAPPIDAAPGAPVWVETTQLPSARSLGCITSYGSYVYSTGGSFQTVSKVDVLRAPILGTGLLGAWSVEPDLPMPTRWHGCAVDTVFPSLYVVGGDNGLTARDVVYRATINTLTGALGPWVAQTSLPAGRRGAGVVWAGGYLYAIGGEESDGFVLRSTVFQIATGPAGVGSGGWTTTNGLLGNDYTFGTAVTNGRIYKIGGYNGNASVMVSTIGAQGVPGTFAATTSLPGSRERHVSATDGTYVYAIAGEASFGGANLASAYRAPIQTGGTLGAWAPLPNIPLAVTYASAVFAGGRIYVAGGSDGTSQTARVFILQSL